MSLYSVSNSCEDVNACVTHRHAAAAGQDGGVEVKL